MNLYIKLQDGNPVDHPILEDNFKQAFPEIDTNNLPPTFGIFTRKPKPNIGPYEEYMGVEYVQEGESYTDSHIVRQFTPEEIAAKQQSVRLQWAVQGYPSWIFNEEQCVFESPTPYPSDGARYIWDEPTTSWVLFEET